MDLKVMVGLINNTALLLSICLVYDVLFLSPKAEGGAWKKVLSGALLGVICVAVMFSRLEWHSGVIFDTRSILLAVSGLFFGPAPTVIAMAMAAAYRFYLGGDGVMMGVSVILASGLAGILWNRRCRSFADISLSELYLFGLAVHVVMITLMFLLPGYLAADAMMRIGPAVLLVYPMGTVLLGKMMSFRHRRVRTEESLRESEERFAFAMEVTRDGLWDWDVVSEKGYFSPGYYRMLGYRPEEFAIVRERWLDMAHPEDHQWVLQAFDDCVNGRSDSLDVEFRMFSRTGQLLWIHSRGSAVARDAAGRAQRLVGTSVDITERKLAEERIRESEDRYRTLFEMESDATFIIDNESGEIVEVNETAAGLYGYSKRELVGLRNYDLSAEPDETRRATENRLTAIPVRWHRKKDGTVFPVEISAAHLSLKGRPVHIASIRDITERMRYEEERKALQSQLFQSQKIEAIGQLAGGVAHDFNNILTVIFGYTDLLLKKIEPDSPLRFPTEQIQSSAMRAAELTRGLLAFSRKQIMEPKLLEIQEVVREMDKMLGRLVREDIVLRTELAEPRLVVNADAGQIGQVLINLVTNAVDAMPEGGTLSINVDRGVIDDGFVEHHGFGEPGEYALISVSDTGTGMDEETRRRIFEPFFTTKEPGKGTGLGLCIVYGIVKQHGGFITAGSEPGAGTTFNIYLPLGGVAPEEAGASAPGRDAPEHGGETILVAEDDDIVRELNTLTLSEAGYRVIAAANGEEAVFRFKENRSTVDLLVFDVVMPGMDGKRAYEEIRGIVPEVRVLFMSGYTREIVIQKGVPEDDVFFIRKPFRPMDLLLKVREILDR